MIRSPWSLMLAGFGLLAAACEAPHEPPPAPSSPPPLAALDADEAALAKVTAIHGAPGPWAVLGYRMGLAALKQLDLPTGSFDLEVVHHTPNKVQYSCIVDGASAATGVSTGKLNLKLAPSTDEAVFTEYVNKKTGARLALRPTAAFRDRYSNADRAKAYELGKDVLRAQDAALFEAIPLPDPGAP